jgi:hypothetical protein
MSDLLPQGLKFLQPAWWLYHAVAVYLVYVWAYRKGRRDERAARLLGVGEKPKR